MTILTGMWEAAQAANSNGVVGIPLRYMHTPVEMVAMKDIARAGRLLAEFAASLDEKYMDDLKLDE